MSVSLTGSDTTIINNRVINDLSDADCVNLDFPNELATVKTGKNGNVIYAFNETGKQATVTLRILRGSSDDKFLNGLITNMKSNFSGFILMTGEFIKKVGDGEGNITRDTYIMSGGVFKKQVGGKTNAEGDTEQSVVIYELEFSNAPRALT